ncbi:ATP-dependent DNA helicase [uncultured Chitinophaga sp.]|uniref:ATP-dependent helicase n=1 Tax=uncultured Chitinophaga sp. TaxID=339340 RepID=UPI0025F8B225|nr:ATP-dependent DNA helicase [uncultured Chitinophaga sp.]
MTISLNEYIRLSKANKAQLRAITNTEGPQLIIAGPGSGKTFTLVERIIYLILNGIIPEKIFIATFTEKAAKELITRVSNRLLEIDLKVNLNEMYIGTLHSIFLRILEENREFTRLRRNFRLLDSFDQKYFIFRNINSYLKVDSAEILLGGHKANRWDKAQKIINYINKISDECLEIEALKNARDQGIQVLGKFYEIYLQQLSDENACDFSTLQSETLFLLENQPTVLKKLHHSLQYFMVDEYQDTNTIQEKIILLLSNVNNNLCVVGDDDQGLYRFRGATIRNILEFPSNFKSQICEKVILDINYRSHPDIINLYNNWIAECDWREGSKSFRFDKVIKPREGLFSEMPAVVKLGSEGDWEDYFNNVYKFIDALKKSGGLSNYNQIAFLFKSVKNDNVIALAQYLEERGIPVFSPRSALFFERTEIQLLLGAIIFIFPNLFEDLKWNEEANLSIWDTYLSYKNRFANEIRKDLKKHEPLLKYCQKKAKEHLTLSKSTNYGFSGLLYQLLEFPMFADSLQTGLSNDKTSLRAAYNIAMLSKLLYKFEYLYNLNTLGPENLQKSLQNLFNQFLRFIIEGGIEEYEDFDEFAPSDCVSFMTIHQSKGLEFPIAIVGSLNLSPRKQYDKTDEILQNEFYKKAPFEPLERTKDFDFYRLFYTAFSRPQNLLVLTAKEKNGQGKNPSKYFEKIYSSLSSWNTKQFDGSKLSLETVKSANIRHEYSFTSHILLFENCPLQYKFYKELEFVEVRTGGVLGGSLLHQTIEDIHKAVLRNQEDTLTDENITDWYNNNYILLSKQQRSYLQQGQLAALLHQVLRYRDRNQHQWDRIKEAEVDVSLVKDSYIIKGTIDLIKGDNNTVELIDFKSGNKPDVNTNDPKDKQRLNQYQRQLEVYAYLVEERTGYRVSKMHLYYPKEDEGSPYITFSYESSRINQTIANFDGVVNKIERKDFDMANVRKSEKQCGDCDMRYHCNPKQYQ